MAKFSRGHAANIKVIASCADNGVGIDALEGAPNFRFTPIADIRPDLVAGQDSFTNGASYGGPLKRGSVSVSCKPKPKGIRNWNPARHSLDPHYEIAMAGDDSELTKARRAYAKGNPELLRKWLKAEADERAGLALLAAAPVQLALAA